MPRSTGQTKGRKAGAEAEGGVESADGRGGERAGVLYRGGHGTAEERDERADAAAARASTITIIYARGTLTLTFNVPLLP